MKLAIIILVVILVVFLALGLFVCTTVLLHVDDYYLSDEMYHLLDNTKKIEEETEE